MMDASKLSAGILSFMFLYAKWTGLICFRFRNLENNVMVMEESWNNRPWWKCFMVILRLVPLCIYVSTLAEFISRKTLLIEQILQATRLVFSVSCYTSMIYLNIFHGSKVSKLVNRYLDIFRQVNPKANRISVSIGGRRVLLLILLSVGCQIQEIVFLFGMIHWAFSLENMVVFASHTYVIIASNTFMRISFIWYLSLGVLCANLSENLQIECLKNNQRYQNSRHQINKTQRLKRTMSLCREITYVVTSLQDISSVHLFLSGVQSLFQIVTISFKMINDLQFSEIKLWLFFVKIMIDLLIYSLATQNVADQFRSFRELTLDICLVDESKDWIKTVEIFVTHLNLNEFRVRLLGLFDFSNKQFLVIVSGMVTYLVFVVQSVIQFRKN
ncbi:putative gustatory receptor 92a [Drosophila elegans]|uniref:putative gustatory receptor 92a n=1 Tax=Drosophila elegans TaxID=30023 RepID=UPI0007E5F45B|nr:putative gustatory receptor 92a [Drosophila elegans]